MKLISTYVNMIYQMFLDLRKFYRDDLCSINFQSESKFCNTSM
jgi:hypothetical protein